MRYAIVAGAPTRVLCLQRLPRLQRLQRLRSLPRLLCLLCGMLGSVAAAPARGELPDPTLSFARSDVASMWVCPRSDGNAAAWVVPTGIEAFLKKADGSPLALVPAADIWLTSTSSSFVFCGGAMLAELESDENGMAAFSHYSPPAGGCLPNQTPGQPLSLRVVAMGVSIPSNIPFSLNSPDITGDLQVNLGDVGPFSAALNGTYNWCSDFFADGVVNLSDVGIFSAHLGHGCN